LPIDPADLNRSYDAVVRVNSQSGKGGVSFLLQQQAGYELPRKLQMEFSQVVQKVGDETGKEVNSEQIAQLFQQTYLAVNAPLAYENSQVVDEGDVASISIEAKHYGRAINLQSFGTGPLDAAAKALSIHIGEAIEIVEYHEHGLGGGAKAEAVSYVEIKIGETNLFGVGQDKNITVAAVKSLLNAVNRYFAHLNLAQAS
jgi:2-isopropylmalate synthase